MSYKYGQNDCDISRLFFTMRHFIQKALAITGLISFQQDLWNPTFLASSSLAYIIKKVYSLIRTNADYILFFFPVKQLSLLVTERKNIPTLEQLCN